MRWIEEEDLHEGMVTAIKMSTESVSDETYATRGEHGGQEGDVSIELLGADKIVGQVR